MHLLHSDWVTGTAPRAWHVLHLDNVEDKALDSTTPSLWSRASYLTSLVSSFSMYKMGIMQPTSWAPVLFRGVPCRKCDLFTIHTASWVQTKLISITPCKSLMLPAYLFHLISKSRSSHLPLRPLPHQLCSLQFPVCVHLFPLTWCILPWGTGLRKGDMIKPGS